MSEILKPRMYNAYTDFRRVPEHFGASFNATASLAIPQEAIDTESPRDIYTGAQLWGIPGEGLYFDAIKTVATAAGAVTQAGTVHFAWFTRSSSNGYPKRIIAGTKSTRASLQSVYDTTLGFYRWVWPNPILLTPDMCGSPTTEYGSAWLMIMWEKTYTGAPASETANTIRARAMRGPAFGDSINFERQDLVWTGATPTIGTFPGEAADIDTDANWGPVSATVVTTEVAAHEYGLELLRRV